MFSQTSSLHFFTFSMQIMTNNWTVPAIRIYIIPKDAFPHRYVAIGIYKPADLWVVVSCLEIVEPRFLIVDIPTVPERVLGSQGACERTSARDLPAPAVIGIFYYGIVITVNQTDNIVLPIADIVVIRTVVIDRRCIAARIVAE